jgi:glycosyltransferase involved in cell wall biosynthesis
MRIVFLVTQLEAGGAQRVALELADALRARGHVVETWFFYEKARAYADARGVRVLQTQRPRSIVSFLALLRQLRVHFRRFTPDVAVSFTHYANVIGLLMARASGVRRRIASQHNPGWTYPRFARWLDRAIGSTSTYSGNIAVSSTVRASFSGYPAGYRRRLTVVPNGISARRVSESRGELRARMLIPDDAFLVLAVGRLHAQKNHALLINSLASAPGVRLAIAGEGELRPQLERMAGALGVQDRVHFLGFVAGDRIGSLMAAADVFAMPSRFEGQSIALIEALATPLPIVSSNIESQAEVLTPQGTGPCALLLDCDDAQSWSAAFCRLAVDTDLRQRLAAGSARRAVDFSLDVTVRGYEAVMSC